jgi:hypothetical protein
VGKERKPFHDAVVFCGDGGQQISTDSMTDKNDENGLMLLKKD